jgi:predicted signal transduction protein with EAL and GGDEF domain
LQEAANRMKESLRNNDTIARIGGDEFICLLPNLKDRGEAEQIAKRILNTLSKPFIIFEQEIFITASIGISIYPNNGDSSEELITNADLAMYNAKRKGRHQIAWFNAELHAGGFEKLLLENSLRKALENNHLQLVYQPQYDIKRNKIIAVEALLRWNHPELGVISPKDFIPIAEETGLIIPIGEWVIYEACRQNKEWQDKGYTNIKVAVNLSAKQFAEVDLPKVILNALERTKLEAKWLEIEVTESMVFQDINSTISTLNRIKEMGVYISIDDFGTGYSSLSYLGKLPIDILKIDRSFIKEIETDNSSLLVTNAIIKLAHSLDLDVVAEGVETVGQLTEIRKQECDIVQGYIFSKPLNQFEIEEKLKI